MAVIPMVTFASVTGDLQRRVAMAYEHVYIDAAEMRERELLGAARTRVKQLQREAGWLDFYYGSLHDGGPALKLIFVEFQYDATGSGVVEAYRTNGALLVRAHFSQTQNLTWEFVP